MLISASKNIPHRLYILFMLYQYLKLPYLSLSTWFHPFQIWCQYLRYYVMNGIPGLVMNGGSVLVLFIVAHNVWFTLIIHLQIGPKWWKTDQIINYSMRFSIDPIYLADTLFGCEIFPVIWKCNWMINA